MSTKLEREGIFMARPVSWYLRTFESQAVAINIEFQVLGALNAAGGWDDWRQYDEHTVYGMFFVIKKDGTINTTAVEQLAASLSWNGDIYSVTDSPPPQKHVQINVRAESYKDTIIYKVAWINPKDFRPQPAGATPNQVSHIVGRFGSLLRAAAAAALAKANVTDAAPTTKAAPPVHNDDDLPF